MSKARPCPICGGVIKPKRGQTAEVAVARHIELSHK